MKNKHVATITVIGRDKTGVIARVTNFLFEQGANIEALEEQVTRGEFSMVVQASWQMHRWSAQLLQQGLERLGRALNMEIKMRSSRPDEKQRCAIFVTRERHCLDAILTATRAGKLPKMIPVLIASNRPDLAPVARRTGISFLHVPWDDRAKAERAACKALDDLEVDFVVLARFMKILSPDFVWRHKNKIINIHPSLLPSFPGPQAYRQAYEAGVKIVGVTSHFVTMHLDEGPIIAQDCLRLRAGMTLPQIVAAGQKLEAKVLIRGIQLYLTRRLDVHWGIVHEV